MTFNPKVIQQGNRLKQQAEETPTSFTTEGGASAAQPTGDLAQKNEIRMAGPGGTFAMKMIQDPVFAARVKNWDTQFAQSNQGMEFNQAKMMMMMQQGGQG